MPVDVWEGKLDYMKFIYPEGRAKALTFSYDDGMIYDRRLVEILRANGLKGTFHLNSGNLGKENGRDCYVTPKEVPALYEGQEVACHGVRHANPTTITMQQMNAEIGEDRKTLEALTGGMVQGMSYAFGNYSEAVKQVAKANGIKYSRTVQDTGNFWQPTDFLEWHPTCHHSNQLLKRGQQFLEAPGFYELPLMYVWGHSFEFEWSGNWELIEQFAELMSGQNDIWYATNLEICNYIQAVRAQEFSADGSCVQNPTATPVWLRAERGILCVEPGTECRL